MASQKRSKSTAKGESSSGSAAAITDILNAIKTCLEGMDVVPRQSLEEILQWSKTNKIAIPFPAFPKIGTPERDALRFSCRPPTNIAVVGSFLLNTIVSPANVDLAVELPSDLFDAKDELNYRYMLKRAYYLARVAFTLRSLTNLKDATFTWSSFRGHVLKPILIIRPTGVEVDLKIHTSVQSDILKLHRFGPGKNLVRKEMALTYDNPLLGTVKVEALNDAPTPIYNSLILSDMLMVEHLKLLHRECKKIPQLADAIKLGKAWLSQRGYKERAFAPSGFQLFMIMAYLSTTGNLDAKMNEIQIFKLTMQFLVNHDFGKVTSFKPISSLEFIPKECVTDYSAEAYQKSSAAILIEPVAGMNLLFDWTVEAIDLLKLDARRTLEKLEEGSGGDWESIFLHPDNALDKFDSFYQASDLHFKLDAQTNFSHYANEFTPQVARLKMIAKKLKLALNTRAHGVYIYLEHPKASSMSQYHSVVDKVGIGLLLNRDEHQRLVELGPLADTEEAKPFRQFWRAKADLRRFQDGSIREAAAWNDFKDKRHLIVEDIVKFVFEGHLQAESIESIDGALDFAWSPNATFTAVNEAYSKLTKALKCIEGLPLSVLKCEAISSNGRMTSIESPDGIKSFPTPVIEILIYFEESSRWPKDYYGLLYAKRAFSAQLCQSLHDTLDLHTSITDDFFDVECSDFIFRCYIHSDSEVALLKEIGMEYEQCELRNFHLPIHSRKINALAQANSIYAPACRLFKRWISSLMYSRQVPEELIDLLVAHAFTVSSKNSPNTVVAAFYRTLRLFYSHPWKSEPLVVTFETDVTEASSIDDTEGHAGTSPLRILAGYESGQPCSSVWSRLCKLSASDFGYLRKLAEVSVEMMNTSDKGFDRLFRSSINRFDMVINTVSLQNTLSKLARSYVNDDQSSDLLHSLPGFDPVGEMLKDIESHFKNLFLYRDTCNDAGFIGVKVATEDASKANLEDISRHIQTSFIGLVASVEVVSLTQNSC